MGDTGILIEYLWTIWEMKDMNIVAYKYEGFITKYDQKISMNMNNGILCYTYSQLGVFDDKGGWWPIS